MIDNREKARRAPTRFNLPVLPPLIAITEIAAFALGLVVIDRLWPAFAILDVQPNPLWVPVLLVSLQYGTVSGLLAAAAAIVVTMVKGAPEQDVEENLFTYLMRIWAEPILWLSGAVLLGQFRMRQLAERQELRRKVEELSVQRTTLAGYASSLRERCEAMERELVTRPEGASLLLLSGLAALASGETELAPAFARAVAEAFPGAQASVFAVDDLALRRLADTGWPQGAPWQTEIARTHPLYRATVEQGRALSVLHGGDEVLLDGEGLAAVPVRADGSGRVVGLLKLEQVEPAWLTEATLPALRLIAMALAARLEVERSDLAGQACQAPGSTAVFPSTGAKVRRQVHWVARNELPDVAEPLARAASDAPRPRAVR